MRVVSDTYTVRARLIPPLIVALPLGITTLALFPNVLAGWSILWSLFVWSGGTFLLAQIGRDWGKKKETKLFESWGGKPTTQMLKHNCAHNKVLLARRHKKLEEIMPDIRIPTIEEEQVNPSVANDVYETCVTFLREKTRDKNKFPLVFEENCNYGFRRNLWGMKPLGVAISIVGIVVAGGMFGFDFFQKGLPPTPIGIVAVLANVILLVAWILVFTPNWVRIPGKAYAERLLESCDNL